MSTQKKPIVLVDGSSYLYRAFHALPMLANSKGFPTGAIYGVVNMLKRLLADYSPEYMAVIFDAKGKTFRDEIFAEYKATRKEMPSELSQQIHSIHQIIRALGLPLLMMEGVEADDVIGTLAKLGECANYHCIISTGDKDLAQLVDDKTILINTMSNNVLNPQTVKEKFGVPPELIVDYLTLVGDTSDNIPGVPLVGPKTAAKWLNEYGNLDNLIKNADKIGGKAGENLRNSQGQFPMVKSLVTIKTDLTLPLDFTDLKIQPPNKTELLHYYKEFEFKNWLAELLKQTDTQPVKASEIQYHVITTEKDLDNWLDKLSKSRCFAFKIEAGKKSSITAEIAGVSLAFNPGVAAYIPLTHRIPTELDKNKVLQKLKPLFENANIQKISHDVKFTLATLANFNIELRGSLYDAMLESYLLDSASSNHSLENLALKYLGSRVTTYEDVVGKNTHQVLFQNAEFEKAAHYAAEAMDISLRLHQNLLPRIEAQPGIHHVLKEIEIPLASVLAEMEHTGILIDPAKLKKYEKEFKEKIASLEKEAFTIAGSEFNMNSPKQLQEILFQQLKLPILAKTPKGQPSTADNVLQDLANEFALPKIIIEHRSLSKLISTYTSPLVEQIDPSSGRVHTSYNQATTSTGRLSSSEPNLQNIPVRGNAGRLIRQAFIAAPNCALISADYSQIELRLMAHISLDPNLLRAFQENLDIHQATAAEVWGVSLAEVNADMRRAAKAVNFGIIYGISAFGLTRQLGVDRKCAQEYIDRYFERYPKVKAYMDNTRKQAREQGYVETLWGRRLYLPDIRASQIPRQRAAERAAINAPLQGSAADIIKMAMIKIHRWIKAENVPVKMLLQVHDELVFEADENHLELITQKIREHMMNAVNLKVPLEVSIGQGKDWDSASAH